MANQTEQTDTGVPSNDAYTGMLAISLIALIIGSALLFLDWSQYSGTPQKASLPPLTAPAPKANREGNARRRSAAST